MRWKRGEEGTTASDLPMLTEPALPCGTRIGSASLSNRMFPAEEVVPFRICHPGADYVRTRKRPSGWTLWLILARCFARQLGSFRCRRRARLDWPILTGASALLLAIGPISVHNRIQPTGLVGFPLFTYNPTWAWATERFPISHGKVYLRL